MLELYSHLRHPGHPLASRGHVSAIVSLSSEVLLSANGSIVTLSHHTNFMVCLIPSSWPQGTRTLVWASCVRRPRDLFAETPFYIVIDAEDKTSQL